MNKKVSTAILASGLMFGGLTAAQIASADPGSGEAEAPTEDVVELDAEGSIVNVQDAETDAEVDAQTDEADVEGENADDGRGERHRHGDCDRDGADDSDGDDSEAPEELAS